MNDNLATVGKIYEAFGRGDVPAILALVAEDVRWEEWADNSAQQAGTPWLQARHGKAGVAAFFATLGMFKFNDFRIIAMMAGDNRVAVEIELEVETADGTRMRDQEVQLWSFNEGGEVTRMRHYADTAKHAGLARRAGVAVEAER